jgi:phosphatidylglycerophosphate synthase
MSALSLPLVRHLSRPLSPLLAATRASPNLITTLSLATGLWASWLLLAPGNAVVAAALMVLCYVFDNCDGEVARIEGRCTTFGMHYDTFTDWLVHSAFFAALGAGHAALTGEAAWAWAGWAAAAGGTLNYVIGLALDRRDATAPPGPGDADGTVPATPGEWLLFAFRELSRADFCFIVLALALADALWLLLPAGAVGAQVYWMTRFLRAASRLRA